MMEIDIVEESRKFVESEYKKPGAKYGPAYEGHMVPMHRRAVELAKGFGADLEVVELAAWFHDIGSTIFGRKDHHITSAKIAEEKLIEWNYPKEKIEQVVYCILHHRGSVGDNGKTIESRVITEADVLANFDNVGGIFEAALVYEGLHQQEASRSVLGKLTRKFNQLSMEGQKLVRGKYEAALVLFGGDDGN